MGRWRVLAMLTALTLAAIPAVAQGGLQDIGPEMPETPDEEARLHEEVQVLLTIRELALSPDQIAELGEINAEVNEERNSLREMRESAWAENQDEIETVLNAWMEGQTAPARARTAADRAVNRVNAAVAAFEETRWSAAESFYRTLTVQQRGLVESPAVAAERTARQARMGGLESVGEYVVSELDAIRDLMPDEFQMLALAEAQRIAQAIVGRDAPNLGQMTDVVYDILVDVYMWSTEQYTADRALLPGQISRLLGFTPIEQRAPVAWSELLRVTTSVTTPGVVAALTTDGAGEVE